MLAHSSCKAPSSNWEKGKGEGRRRKEERKGKGEGKGKGECIRREGNGKKGRGRGRGAHFRYSLRYSLPQMLDFSGRLAGREYNVKREGERGREERGRER